MPEDSSDPTRAEFRSLRNSLPRSQPPDELRAALMAALANGAVEVQFADRSVRYRSVAEIREILSLLDSEAAPGSGAPSVFTVAARRGLGPSTGAEHQETKWATYRCWRQP